MNLIKKELGNIKTGFKTKINVTKSQKTLGQRAADKLTAWAGSWTFIIIFLVFLVLWMIFNTSLLIFGQPWDAKPFIMLNLILSCLAAIQAPIILMSQNRQAQRDRIKAEYDYRINKRAEKEIREIKKYLMSHIAHKNKKKK